METPTAPGTWIPLSREQRVTWLDEACARHFARSLPWPSDRKPGSVIVLHGHLIEDLTSFFCVLGEAVNGPGGYFGRSLVSLQDCCVGGYGVAPPFIVRWEEASASRRVLGHAALREWAEERILHSDFLDEDGREWLLDCAARTARGDGETLFDFIIKAIGVYGSTVDER